METTFIGLIIWLAMIAPKEVTDGKSDSKGSVMTILVL
jgi:hypothetical protein